MPPKCEKCNKPLSDRDMKAATRDYLCSKCAKQELLEAANQQANRKRG